LARDILAQKRISLRKWILQIKPADYSSARRNDLSRRSAKVTGPSQPGSDSSRYDDTHTHWQSSALTTL
jgi:hypothetical protein